MRQPLRFGDASFDLVHARLMVGFMDKAAWPALLSECRRVLRPASIIGLTEIETPVSHSPAYQRLYSCMNRAMAQQGRTFSVDGNSMGIVYMLARLLREAGFESVQQRAFCADGSYGMPLHQGGYRDMQALFSLSALSTGGGSDRRRDLRPPLPRAAGGNRSGGLHCPWLQTDGLGSPPLLSEQGEPSGSAYMGGAPHALIPLRRPVSLSCVGSLAVQR